MSGYKESDIVFEKGDYWVLDKKEKGFEVYKIGITHSTRVGIIGYLGEKGINRAKEHIEYMIERDSKGRGNKEF